MRFTYVLCFVKCKLINMSKSIYKAEYTCECGVDYGSCGAKCAVILKSNNSCDIYTIYHTDGHGEKPITTVGGLDCFRDEYLEALSKVIDMTEDNRKTLTEEELEFVWNN